MRATESIHSIQRSRFGLWTSLSLVCFLAVVLPNVIAFLHSGKSATEKLLTGMLQPLFAFLILSIAIGLYLARRGERMLGLLLLAPSIIVWLLGTPIVVGFLFKQWEAEVHPAEITEALDYVVVLGGGTHSAPSGRPQYGEAGDRVARGAELYLTGKAKHLVTTGDVLVTNAHIASKFQKDDDPSIQTRRLWVALGIPDHVIFELSGENTSKEMDSLAEHPEWWRDCKCGVVTSAFHMPRALRLAKQRGIQVIGIPADYRSAQGPFMITDLFPVARELHRFQILLKEWLAAILGR